MEFHKTSKYLTKKAITMKPNAFKFQLSPISVTPLNSNVSSTIKRRPSGEAKSPLAEKSKFGDYLTQKTVAPKLNKSNHLERKNTIDSFDESPNPASDLLRKELLRRSDIETGLNELEMKYS